MKKTTYIVIFCIFHSGLSHQDSESVGESIIDDENKKESEALEDGREDFNEKLNDQESEAFEHGREDFYEKESEAFEDGREDFNEKGNYEKLDDELQNQDDEMEKAREAGDAADLFGTNQHYNIPVNYQDFGRRFVLTYPYVEKNILNDAAEAELDNIVKRYLQSKKTSNIKELTPVKAPPEFVLQIAKQSALLEASRPINPTEEIIQKDILRTGEYWDDVWKEDVDVEKMLRSTNKQNKLGSIKVKISPGSKLHTLISRLKDRSPRFLYVINKHVDR